MDREYWVVEVGKTMDQLLGDIKGPFATYREAYTWAMSDIGHDRWTIVRRK